MAGLYNLLYIFYFSSSSATLFVWITYCLFHESLLFLDGPALMFMNIEDLMTELNVTDSYHQNALHVAIDNLRSTGVRVPQSMWEYQVIKK